MFDSCPEMLCDIIATENIFWIVKPNSRSSRILERPNFLKNISLLLALSAGVL